MLAPKIQDQNHHAFSERKAITVWREIVSEKAWLMNAKFSLQQQAQNEGECELKQRYHNHKRTWNWHWKTNARHWKTNKK